MPRFRRPLTRFLALLLLVQWASAFGQCFAASAAGGDRIEICTADGIHTIVLGEDGERVPEPAVHHPACPECCGPGALEPSPPRCAALPVPWSFSAPALPRAGLPVAPARAPPQQPRAPPTA